jgi:uncharacterized integral membrane protein (TIGR00698 family)
MTTTTHPLGATVPAVFTGVAAIVVGSWLPLLGPLLVALVVGIAVANTSLRHASSLHDHVGTTRLLLRLGIVLLGLRLPAGDLVSTGPEGVVVVVVTVTATFGATTVFGRHLGIEPRLVTLIAAGFSICGAAAIAAVDDAVRPRQRDVALAVTLVTVYGSGMIVLLPWLADVLALSDHQAAVWAGASIHEVAQVVVTASLIGGSSALAVATVVKLGRVVMLAPVHVVAARRHAGATDRRLPPVPWFVAGFVVAVAARSTGLLPDGTVSVADDLTTVLLAAGMFGLGLGVRARDVLPLPGRVVLLATAATVVAAGTSLALVATLVS